MSRPRRALYVQYTNPAGYPPLQHSSRILANSGWEVLMLGTGAHGANDFTLDAHPRIKEERLPYAPPGALQKVHYLRFATRALAHVVRWKPDWCYASDLWSCPIAAWALRLGSRVVYHEHDEPPRENASRYVRACLAARRQVAARAALCVLPSEGRRGRFQAEHPGARTSVVWNCPSLEEVPETRTTSNKEFVVYYHGSIVPQRLPVQVIEAVRSLPDDVHLRIVGYETIGARGYVKDLLQCARTFGIEARVSHQTVPERRHLWQLMRSADVGVSLVPVAADEPNLDTMAGASNKPFEYLAAELALLLSHRADWTSMFGDYGVACSPDSAGSIASALRTLYDDRAATRARGSAGRNRILKEWNYEHQFAPVLQVLNA